MLLIRPLGSGGSGAKLCYLFPSSDTLVHGEVRDREYHESWIGGLGMEVRVFALLRDSLGVPDFAATVCKWGQQHR
jgi:hypothetical protein